MVLHSEEAPMQWKKAMIISIPKKSCKTISNFREISLESMIKFLHSYVHAKQDLEEEKVALSKYTSSAAYLNNTSRKTFL